MERDDTTLSDDEIRTDLADAAMSRPITDADGDDMDTDTDDADTDTDADDA